MSIKFKYFITILKYSVYLLLLLDQNIWFYNIFMDNKWSFIYKNKYDNNYII